MASTRDDEQTRPAPTAGDQEAQSDDDCPPLCPICLAAPDPLEERSLTNCTHRLCADCIARLVTFHFEHLSRSRPIHARGFVIAMRACRCPTCAAPFTLDEVKEVLEPRMPIFSSDRCKAALQQGFDSE